MKKLSSLMLGLLMTAVLFSCSKDDEEISVEAGIVGTWTVASVDVEIDGKSFNDYIEEAIAQMEEQMGDDFTEEDAEMVREMYADFDMSSEMVNTSIEFKEDKKAIVTDDSGSETGTWSVSGDNLTVTFDDFPQTFKVSNMTKSSASLRSSFEEEFDASSSLTVESIINLKK